MYKFEQPRFSEEKTQDVDVNDKLQKKYSTTHNTDEIYYRYYHLFKK